MLYKTIVNKNVIALFAITSIFQPTAPMKLSEDQIQKSFNQKIELAITQSKPLENEIDAVPTGTTSMKLLEKQMREDLNQYIDQQIKSKIAQIEASEKQKRENQNNPNGYCLHLRQECLAKKTLKTLKDNIEPQSTASFSQ